MITDPYALAVAETFTRRYDTRKASADVADAVRAFADLGNVAPPAGGSRAWSLTVGAVLLVLLAGMVAGAAGVAYAQGARGVCAEEDSPACVWVGPLQGNHRGRVVINP